ncbi:glycosyltransferase [Rubinisphaera italica]|uniref:Alpha-D-kanosaminyltransferase n=1 Tax=Rubinisphaera italica TaxID=2527969 RepID=A0A5C5XGK0_9PLAN|nr:glycosyltransferase [Rubinisphaera italica]TWT61829.1 Alpha-D-kanosaminyltransferase [Rubinisphaera italica]
MNTDSSPIPILFCITELDPGGAERAFVHILSRLNRTRWNPRVICLSGQGELVEELERFNIEVICLNGSPRRPLQLLSRLYREIKRFQPVLIQSFLFHANILSRIAGRFAGTAAIVSGIRVAEKRSTFYLKLDRWTERWATKHVCVSEAVREFSGEQGGLTAEKLIVIPNGVDRNRFENAAPLTRAKIKSADSDILALFVGRLDSQKGVSDLLEVAARLKDDVPQLKWLIAGTGPEEHRLKEFANQLELTESVQFLGRRNDVPELMKTADLFVFPSHWEGMPNVILEAMAARLPIVTTNVEGIDQLLEHQVSAEIVPIGDLGKFSASVQKLIQNPELRQQYASKAWDRLSTEFDWQSIADRYQNLYEQLIANEHSKR